jgi:hypothetical protein
MQNDKIAVKRRDGCHGTPTEVTTPPVLSESADNVHYVKYGLLPPVELHRCPISLLTTPGWIEHVTGSAHGRRLDGAVCRAPG